MDSLNNINITVDWTCESMSWQWWTIPQLILALLGIIGNSLVMIVLFRIRRKRCSTDTLIDALAMADFLTSVFIIPHVEVATLPDTLLGQFYCRVIHSSVIMWISICASIFTLTTISIERLTAVIKPFQFQYILSPKRTLAIVVVIWILSFTVNIVVMFVVFQDQGKCVFAYPSVWLRKFVGISLFLIEYLFPVIISISAHIFTIRTINKSRQSAAVATPGKHLDVRRQITNMLFVVIITFIICWTPDQFLYLALNIGLIDDSYLYRTLYRSCVVLAFVNSCANPFISAARNPNFRKALKELCGSVHSLGVQPIFASPKESSTQGSLLTTDMTYGSKEDMTSTSL